MNWTSELFENNSFKVYLEGKLYTFGVVPEYLRNKETEEKQNWLDSYVEILGRIFNSHLDLQLLVGTEAEV